MFNDELAKLKVVGGVKADTGGFKCDLGSPNGCKRTLQHGFALPNAILI